MIKKNGETGKETKSSFKKFSDFNPKTNEVELSVNPDADSKLPGNPNLPNKSSKSQKNASTRYMRPLADKQNYDKEDNQDSIEIENETNESKVDVKMYGKVAKLPKGTKASKGFNFLENVKISKNSIWYLMVEKDNDLQILKYNYKKGVDLSKFINELKTYYISKYKGNESVVGMINKIEIDGNDKYSWIKNIPLVEVDGKKVITKITEDLIKLLSK